MPPLVSGHSDRPSDSLRSYPNVTTRGHASSVYAQSSTSVRASYPSFLSFPETLALQASWIWHGFFDAFRWDIVISTVASDAEIRANILKSLLLNGLSLLSIYIFDLLLQPLVQDQQKWLHRNMGWFYKVLWLFPVVGASLYLNGSWCSIVANRVYTLRHGSRKAAPSTYAGILTAIATSAYRAVMICTSVVLAFALSYIPVVGSTAGFVFFCWVDAFYCFESVWIARGHSLAQRITHLEERWAYYLAFGLPSSALCMWGNTLANAAIFALVLPSYIIMAIHAKPVPNNPYNPVHTLSESGTIRYPSPFIPIRLRIFAPVVWINDRIVRILSIYGGRRPYSRAVVAGKKDVSDSVVESVEEGNGDNFSAEAMHSVTRPVHTGGTFRVTNTRRRKVD